MPPRGFGGEEGPTNAVVLELELDSGSSHSVWEPALALVSSAAP